MNINCRQVGTLLLILDGKFVFWKITCIRFLMQILINTVWLKALCVLGQGISQGPTIQLLQVCFNVLIIYFFIFVIICCSHHFFTYIIYVTLLFWSLLSSSFTLLSLLCEKRLHFIITIALHFCSSKNNK